MSAWNFGFDGLQRFLSSAGSQQGTGSNGKGVPDQVKPWISGPVPVGALGIAAGLALGPVMYQNQKKLLAAFEGTPGPLMNMSSLPFASISSATVAPESTEAGETVDGTVEPRTGLSFPNSISLKKKPCCKKKGEKELNDQRLAGVGVRVKKIMGLAGIKVYAFGLYVDPQELKSKLGKKYKGLPLASLKGSKWLLEDLMESDCPVTVRLVINYKGLKIGQVRNAFNESLGGSLKTISGKPEPDLLHSFTKWFSEEHVLTHGTVINLKRTPGYVVTTEFDGKPAGGVTSSLLSRALLSLYLGAKPFDSVARDAIQDNIAAMLIGK